MFAHVQNMHQAYEENSKLSFTGDLSLRKCQNTIKIILWNMADDDKVPETHSESVMGVALPFQVVLHDISIISDIDDVSARRYS